MFDHLLTDEHRRVRDEAREFVKTTPRELILDMDAERVHFPKEWLREAAHRRLLGVRHPVRWGGRGLDWVAASAVSEEIGSLSYELACVFGVGADLVCDAILSHGTDAQKERYVAPLLNGELFAAECLTEPRGGSDFFGATTRAEDCGDYFLLNGQKRFIVGAEGADYFLVYARTDPRPDVPPRQTITCFIVAPRSRFRTASARGFRVLFSDCLNANLSFSIGGLEKRRGPRYGKTPTVSGNFKRLYQVDDVCKLPRMRKMASY
jgi:alkylation response protein AidB-like acyl-CoA dehydrogenase